MTEFCAYCFSGKQTISRPSPRLLILIVDKERENRKVYHDAEDKTFSFEASRKFDVKSVGNPIQHLVARPNETKEKEREREREMSVVLRRSS